MSQEQEKAAKLTDLVNDWMRRDPLLCQHFNWDWPKTHGQDMAFFIGSHPTPDTTSYAVGYVSDEVEKYGVATWHWGKQKGSFPSRTHRQTNIYHSPADPQFFENLKKGLIIGHNSLTHLTKCSI